jgi:ribosomal protein S21
MKNRNYKGTSDLLYVKVKNNNVDGALKIFKQRAKENGLLLEIKEKSFYQKKSEKRRIQKNLAKIRQKSLIEKEYRDLY